jgi:hypothetical protein
MRCKKRSAQRECLASLRTVPRDCARITSTLFDIGRLPSHHHTPWSAGRLEEIHANITGECALPASRKGVDVGMRAWLACGLILCSVLSANASEKLQLRVTPKVSSAPADVLIYVSIQRDAENRLLRVTADSAAFFRSSETQLDGEESPRVAVFTYRNLPSGNYTIVATLIGSNGRATDTKVIYFVVI